MPTDANHKLHTSAMNRKPPATLVGYSLHTAVKYKRPAVHNKHHSSTSSSTQAAEDLQVQARERSKGQGYSSEHRQCLCNSHRPFTGDWIQPGNGQDTDGVSGMLIGAACSLWAVFVYCISSGCLGFVCVCVCVCVCVYLP